ncbi:hypothetical protein PTKIN_Ptkin16aG0530600 [Pterospermum kingtungense]
MPSSPLIVISKSTVYPDRKSNLKDLKLSVSDLPMFSCHYIQKEFVKEFFSFDKTVSYQGHHKLILAIQVTELADGVFIGCSVNHTVIDGTSFWNFLNTFAEIYRKITNNINNNNNNTTHSVEKISRQPNFSSNSALISSAILRVLEGGPKVTFNENEPLRERIFSFSKEAILELKAKVNRNKEEVLSNGDFNTVEIMGKLSNDKYYTENGKN